MHCERARAWMERYLVEGLAADERELFEFHVRDCRGCHQRLHDLQRLLATLGSAASPPVPEGFVGRVMARARQEVQPSLGGRHAFRGDWKQPWATRFAHTAAAMATGLLLGLVLGWESWQLTASGQGADQSPASVNTETIYSLDYLSGTPRGSFTESYLNLTRVTSEQEFHGP